VVEYYERKAGGGERREKGEFVLGGGRLVELSINY
jgi:hypothetical protein